MNRVLLVAILFSAALAGGATAPPDTVWMPLYNGKDLTGWNYSQNFWRSDGGVIHGEGKPVHNTFCFVGGKFSDFVLVAKTRLWQTGAGYTNSGIQYRSAFLDSGNFRMKGYQWDIGDGWDGSMYPEGGFPSGSSTVAESDACKKANRRNDWNQVVIIADGNRVIHRLNGTDCIDYKAEVLDGYIGLQLHASNLVTRVEFKDIFIRPLNGSFRISDSSAIFLDSTFSPPMVSIRGNGDARGASPEAGQRGGSGAPEFDLQGRWLGPGRTLEWMAVRKQ